MKIPSTVSPYTLSFTLQALPRSVILHTTSDYAHGERIVPDKITLNNKPFGLKGKVIPGQYIVIIQKDGHYSQQFTVTIAPGKIPYTIKRKFVSKPRTIDLSIRNSFNLDQVDPEIVSLNGSDVRENVIKPGLYRLVIRQRGYAPIVEQIIIPPGNGPYRISRRLQAIARSMTLRGVDARSFLVARHITKPEKRHWRPSKQPANAARIYVGNKEVLILKHLRVMVKIENLRARTIVDHIFYNPYKRQLQGKFQYRLPNNSSICYFAFYPNLKARQKVTISNSSIKLPQLPSVNAEHVYNMSVQKIMHKEKNPFGLPKIAYIVPKQKALKAYEATVRANIDPALVEWQGGNVFSARVFPLQAQSYQRVVIAYEQTLPKIQKIKDKSKSHCWYTFSFPKVKNVNIDLLLAANNIQNSQSNLKLAKRVHKDFTSYRWNGALDSIAQNSFAYSFPSSNCEYITGIDGKKGPRYLYARLSPQLATVNTGLPHKALFLLDTSLSQAPKQFKLAVKLLRRILEQKNIVHFNILFFNVETSWLNSQQWVNNTAKERDKLAFLEKIILEGATNIKTTLDAISKAKWLNTFGQTVDIFLLSNGFHTWGKDNLDLARWKQQWKFTPRIYRYALGMGAHNRYLFSLFDRHFYGATFNCYSEEHIEKVSLAHQKQPLYIEKMETKGLIDIFGSQLRCIYPGQKIFVAAKVIASNPQIIWHGNFCGQKKQIKFDFSTTINNSLAPRAFGEMVVNTLETIRDTSLEKTIIAFARHFSVPGKTCSLLMLDSKRDYDRFNIKHSIKQKDVSKIQITKLLAGLAKSTSSKKRLMQFCKKTKSQFLRPKRIEQLLSLLKEEHFTTVKSKLTAKILQKSQLPETYIKALQSKSQQQKIYLDESKRRFKTQLPGEALQCISSLVELKSQDAETLRMVYYCLANHQLASYSLPLLLQVLEMRPFEPQSYRDLAKCYAACGQYALAAFYSEMLLAKNWERFKNIKKVFRQEYIAIMQQALRAKNVSGKVQKFLKKRLDGLLQREKQPDIAITITWNTNDSDVDLWVIEPSGEKCYYSHKNTKSGGVLFEDITGGYGPERYTLPEAIAGKYKVELNYYRSQRTKLNKDTIVKTTIVTCNSSGKVHSQSFTSVLEQAKQKITVAEFTWK